jgi:hypothetical protein
MGSVVAPGVFFDLFFSFDIFSSSSCLAFLASVPSAEAL